MDKTDHIILAHRHLVTYQRLKHAGLHLGDRMIKNSARCNRLVDGSPVPDVEGSDEICLSLKTTGNTSEMRSFRPVPFVDDMAYLAFPAGVVWINGNDGDACFPCLVFYERP